MAGESSADRHRHDPASGHGGGGHRPHGRRRRRGRPRLLPLLAVGAVVAAVGAMVGLGGGYSLVVLLNDEPVSAEEQAARADFLEQCSALLTNIDCGCLWRDARPAFTPQTQGPVLTLIHERRELPVRLQRIRSEKLLGPDLAKQVWDAAYHCAER